MMADEIARRNAQGVMETLRTMETLVREQQLMLNKFSELVGDLTLRVAVLEQAEAARRIAAMGRGPTAR